MTQWMAEVTRTAGRVSGVFLLVSQLRESYTENESMYNTDE